MTLFSITRYFLPDEFSFVDSVWKMVGYFTLHVNIVYGYFELMNGSSSDFTLLSFRFLNNALDEYYGLHFEFILSPPKKIFCHVAMFLKDSLHCAGRLTEEKEYKTSAHLSHSMYSCSENNFFPDMFGRDVLELDIFKILSFASIHVHR